MNFGSIWSKAATTSSDVVIGIDFGTSNSCVSVWRPDKKRIKIIRNKVKPIGNKTTPSTILFEDGFDEWTIGSTNFFDDDNSILSNIKPCLGADGAVTSNEIIGLKSQFDAAGDKLMIECMDQNQNTRLFSAEDLASKILKYLKECAEEYLTRKPFKIVGEDGRLISPAAKKDSTVRVTKVVIGIPVNYTERKKDAIRSAAFSAGFEEVHLMIESTAAAMSYGLLVAGTKHVLVVDIGGGTTDLTVMHISDGTYSIEATGGHVTLGGCNMDLQLAEKISSAAASTPTVAAFAGESSLITSIDKAFENLSRGGAKSQLLQLCKACKEELSGVDEARIAVPSGVSDCFYVSEQQHQQTANKESKASKSHPVLEIAVSRAEFSAAIKDITDLITGTIVHTVQQWIDKKATASGTDGGISFDVKSCIDEIVLVGGASRVPAVHSAIRAACEALGITKYAEHISTAATAAATVDESGGENTATASGKKTKKKTGKSASAEKSPALTPTAVAPYEFCTSVDPDQVVAEGLAIRGAILSGATDCSTLKDILMMDCLAMSVGLMSWSSSSSGDNSEKNRKFDAILHKGDKLPAKASNVFQLGDPNQRFVSLDMYEQIDQQRLIPGADGAPNRVETEFIFNVIGTADVPIPPRPASTGKKSAGAKGNSGSGETRRSIEVVFRMDDQGALSYEVLHCEEGDNGGNDIAGSGVKGSGSGRGGDNQEEEVDPQSSRASLYLLLYIGLMAALYIAVKVLLVEVQVKEGGTNSNGSGDSGDDTLSSVVSGIVEKVSAFSHSDADNVNAEL